MSCKDDETEKNNLEMVTETGIERTLSESYVFFQFVKDLADLARR